MFDIGWDEMLLVVLAALIIIGPEDLPNAIRSISKFIDRTRGFVRDFFSSMNRVGAGKELTKAQRELELINIDIQEIINRKILEAESRVHAEVRQKSKPKKTVKKKAKKK